MATVVRRNTAAVCQKIWYMKYFETGKYLSKLLQCSRIHSSPPNLVIELKMPSLSPTMVEGTIIKWMKKEGDPVNPGDVLCDIQTDKAVIAFETEEEGTLAKICIDENSKDIKIGTTVALLAEPGENWQAIRSEDHPTKKLEGEAVPTKESSTSQIVVNPGIKTLILGPAVKLLLQQYGLKANTVPGSGPHGYLLKGDILAYIQKENLKPQSIKNVSSENVPIKSFKPASIKSSTSKSSSSTGEEIFQDVEISDERRNIADLVVLSKMMIPHVYTNMDFSVQGIECLRKNLRLDGINLSVRDFVIKAVATSLELCPEMNVIWKNEEVYPMPAVDISISIATQEAFVYATITDAANRGLQSIAETVRLLTDRARLHKLQPQELHGGSFTISYLEDHGVSYFAEIINPPQCGILAVAGPRHIIGGNGEPVTVMSTTLSYDERAISASSAAKFMSILQTILERPQSLLLNKDVCEALA